MSLFPQCFYLSERFPSGRTTAMLSGVRSASVLTDKFYLKISLHATNAIVKQVVILISKINIVLCTGFAFQEGRAEHSEAAHQVRCLIFFIPTEVSPKLLTT